MLDDPLRRGCGDYFILPANRAGARREQAGNGFEQSRFASAVGADESDHFAGANHQIDAVKGQKRAVGNLKTFYFEHLYLRLFWISCGEVCTTEDTKITKNN